MKHAVFGVECFNGVFYKVMFKQSLRVLDFLSLEVAEQLFSAELALSHL